jgi:hypothetical protein
LLAASASTRQSIGFQYVAGARTLIALPRDLQPLTDNESDDVLEHAFRGRDVAGGRGGYLEYRRDGAYICQAGRAFSNEPRHGVAFWRKCDMTPSRRLLPGLLDAAEAQEAGGE